MEQLKKCPFCGGEAKALTRSDGYEFTEYVMCGNCEAESGWFKTKAEAIAAWNTRKQLERYKELEEKLQSVYGECDGLLEKVVEELVKHEGVEFEKPMKARLLTDDDVDKWDRLKGAMERIVERLEQQERQYNRRAKEFLTLGEKVYHEKHYAKACSYDHAIKIVKEEME